MLYVYVMCVYVREYKCEWTSGVGFMRWFVAHLWIVCNSYVSPAQDPD